MCVTSRVIFSMVRRPTEQAKAWTLNSELRPPKAELRTTPPARSFRWRCRCTLGDRKNVVLASHEDHPVGNSRCCHQHIPHLICSEQLILDAGLHNRASTVFAR